jgi:hypothetical protein
MISATLASTSRASNVGTTARKVFPVAQSARRLQTRLVPTGPWGVGTMQTFFTALLA